MPDDWEALAAEAEDDDIADDWEALAASDEDASAPTGAPDADPEVPESLRPGGRNGALLPFIGESDVLQGVGNALNIQQGMARAGNALGLIDDQDTERLLKTIRADQEVRRDRGYGYGAGELLGNAAVGALASPLAAGARGAAAVGAVEGGVSELARTGDALDAARGAVVGGVAGGGAHMLGSAAKSAAGHLRKGLPKGQAAKAAASQSEAIAQRARQAAADLGAQADIDVPAPRALAGTYEDALSQLRRQSPGAAKHATGTPGQLRKAATSGQLGPKAMSDIAGVRALKGVRAIERRPFGIGADGKSRILTDTGLAAGQWSLDRMGDALRHPAALGMAPPAAAEAAGPASVEGQYLEAMPAPSPADDTEPEMRAAMLDAIDSPALGAYPGLQTKLSTMLQGWMTGQAPTDSDVALMAYRLSNIPGLDWSALEPETDTWE